MARKTAMKTTGGKESLVVTRKVKSYIRSKGLMTSSDTIVALNAEIYALLDDAAERTKANRRCTIKPQDL